MIRHFGMKRAVDEVKKPRQQLALRQVAGRAEQNDDLRQLRTDPGRYLRHRASPVATPRLDQMVSTRQYCDRKRNWARRDRFGQPRYSPSSRPSFKQALEAAIGRGRETGGDGRRARRSCRPAPKPAARPVPRDRARGRRDRRGCGFRRATADRGAAAARAARANAAGSRCRRRRARRSPPRARPTGLSARRVAQTTGSVEMPQSPNATRLASASATRSRKGGSVDAAGAMSSSRDERGSRAISRPTALATASSSIWIPSSPSAIRQSPPGSDGGLTVKCRGATKWNASIRSRRMSRRIMPARRPWVITASRKARPLKMSRYCSRARSSPRASARMVSAPAGAMPSSRLAATLHSPT